MRLMPPRSAQNDRTPADALEVCYWGTTGTVPRPVTPDELTDKIASVIVQLRAEGLWPETDRLPNDVAAVAAYLEANVPYCQRNTYLGNTSCIEVCAGHSRFLVDGGSGLREWSAHRPWDDFENHLLLTHAHLDHVMGIPFCDALYSHRSSFTLWASSQVLESLRRMFGPLPSSTSPLFAITLDQLVAIRAWRPLTKEQPIELDGTRIGTHELCHPGGATAIRFDRGHRRMVIVTDHEHLTVPDLELAQFAAGADVLYLDAQYLQSEYDGQQGIGGAAAQCRHGWGHSSLEACIETAIQARVRSLHLGHHEPRRSDHELAQIEHYAQQRLRERLEATGFPVASIRLELAREGSRFCIS
jgi:phosphoribosyl 1,2-cyclic phosphodiesterase